jgi:dihydroorotate dehydrogenase electron transfer subunit
MALSSRGSFIAVVRANIPLCREHFRLVLELENFPPTLPGQFVQLSCRDLRLITEGERELDWVDDVRPHAGGYELSQPVATLRRPFSLAGRRDRGSKTEIDIIHRVVGIGTDFLSHLKEGDEVGVLGPLGNKFTLPQENQEAILVGGGVGIPPMLYLAEKLAGRKATAFAGALTRDLLPLTIVDAEGRGPDDIRPLSDIAQFVTHGVRSVSTTDDGSYGFRGYVTQALEAYLEGSGFRIQGSVANSGPSSLNPEPRTLNPVIYTCGPEPMMKRVGEIALGRGIECQIAVERAMACGMGTCQSCCIKVKKPDPTQPPLAGKDWCYRLACTDGPVFLASQLLW